MVNQHKNLMVFDGEGRPLIEKEGDRSYHVNDPPPPSNWEPDVQKYQVWSSVLGSALTTFDASGNKLETRVFAGSTLIARQKRITIGNQATDTIEWATADPVTESSVKFEFNSGGSGPVFEENEPLGQKVSVTDPTEFPPASYESFKGSATDPEWQCEIPRKLYGGLYGMPTHCMVKAIMNAAPAEDLFPEKAETIRIYKPGPPQFNVPTAKPFNLINDDLSLTAGQRSNSSASEDSKPKYDMGKAGNVTVEAGLIDVEDTGISASEGGGVRKFTKWLNMIFEVFPDNQNK